MGVTFKLVLNLLKVTFHNKCCINAVIFVLFHLQVSLDSRVRELINKSMVQPTTSTFDEAQLQIYTLMHRDSYPRFLNSSLYKNLLHQLQQKQQSQPPH